jgi:hypothetical protein
MVWSALIWHMIRPGEHGNGSSGPIKCREVLEWMHNWKLLKKGSAT